jgi:sugar phosphate permease
LGYTLASFLGSPAAGVLAASLAWEWAFRASGGIMVMMATICLIVFTVMERKGLVRYGQYKPKEKGVGNIKLLIRRQLLRFSVIAILTGVVRTAVLFWLPTYISQYLQFDPSTAALVYTVGTLCVSSSTFLAIFLYEKPMKRNIEMTILLSFASSAVCFAGAYLIPVELPFLNVVFMVLAILSANCASNMIWSRYCPSLFDTGMVSGATGFLDCCSYLAASAATALFANAVPDIGWGNLILVWAGLMVLGILVSTPIKKKQ